MFHEAYKRDDSESIQSSRALNIVNMNKIILFWMILKDIKL